MASPAAPPVAPSLSTGSSSNRVGWGRGGEPSSALRGASGRSRGASRGGRGSRGGRSSNREPSARSESTGTKSSTDQAKEKAPSQATKPPPSPVASAPTASNSPPTATNKASARARNPRRPSEQKSEQKVARTPSGGIETSTSSRTMQPPAPSSNTSGRGASRRGNTQVKSVPPPAPVAVPKQSLSARSSRSQLAVEQTVPAAKDVPPHLQPPPTPSSLSVKNDVEALVEHVRSIAMDRPFTPGSHIDWASDDDDSLPDLPDWGLPVPAANTGRRGSIISPILEDALRPLPSLDPSTPILVVSDAQQEHGEAVSIDALLAMEPTKGLASHRGRSQTSSTKDSSSSDQPETDTAPSNISEAVTKQPEDAKPKEAAAKDDSPTASANKDKSSSPRSSERNRAAKGAKAVKHPSLPAKPEPAKEQPVPAAVPAKSEEAGTHFKGGLADSIHAPKRAAVPEPPSTQESTPVRGLEASMHSPSKSESAVTARLVEPLSPPHARSCAMGRFGHRQPHAASQGNIPDRHLSVDHSSRHVRNHSTPPTGPGTATAHARTVRPVITTDAMSRLMRTLGGAAQRREAAAAAAAAAKE